jgi:hypothetical protein
MKPQILLTALIIFIFFLIINSGCRKNNTITGSQPADIYGSWNWLKSSGGFAYQEFFPPPQMRQVYNEDGTFQLFRNDSLQASTSYTIRREMTGWSHDSVYVIYYKDSLQFQPQMFTSGSDSLILRDLCMDCFTHIYKRIQ